MSDTTHDQVILVDTNDHEIGVADKLQAHRDGLLHRAISVFIRQGNRILLQQRAANKYHSANLWSNTCCSHPRPGEDMRNAAKRRLREEMGINCELQSCGFFIYHSHYENGMIEYELDHVFVGELTDPNAYIPNPNEAQATQWIELMTLKEDLAKHPERYSSWLERALSLVKLV